MNKTMKQYATAAGGTFAGLIDASFQQVFDKKGNPTGKTHASIGGYSYDNITADQFSQGYQAANELSVLDQFDAKLEGTIATFRTSIDGLIDIAAGLTDAQGYLKSGGDFLAVAGKDTLSGIVTLAEGMQQAGETIQQTIDRLIQAQQQYDQFVGQFKPAATYASDFQATLAGIDSQMQQNIATANALARAAGAEGASTEDLTNIHKYAAAQFAQAVAALKQSTQNLAASLGYAMPTDLNSINSEISALESQQQAASHAINGFGSAMQSAAQKATDAMNLLLGDLSPYNDQQKLQMALQGQQAGTVTPQQVLEIARRLDATGADYTAIFNQVMAIGDRTQRNQGGGGGGGSSSFSAGDAQRLDDLKKQRDQLEAAQRHHDALQLAQNIADEVGATGETIDQALQDAGITDLTPFLKDLGISNKDGFDKFIEGLEKNTDSAGDDTRDIASRLDLTNVLLTQIRDGTTGSAGTGHGTHANPNAIDDNTRALDDNTAATRQLSRTGGGGLGNVNNPAAPPQLPGGRSSRGGTDIAGTRTR